MKLLNDQGLRREIVRLAGILLAICAVTAGLLGWVNSITRDKIAAAEADSVKAALAEVMPGADRFEPLGLEPGQPGHPPAPFESAWAAYHGQELAGLCVQVGPQGFGGVITAIVGVAADGTVSGVRITRQTETAGLGVKAADPLWLAQFEGLSGPLGVLKTGPASGQNVVAVTAATITSQAVADGVQAALDFALGYLGGGA